MNFTHLQKKAAELVMENASTILTGGGVIGTVSTAVLTARASFAAARDIDRVNRQLSGWTEPEEAAGEIEEEVSDKELPPLMTRKEKILRVWPFYVPAALVGTATIGSIVMANRISVQRAAALAAAYGISEGRLQEYRDKVQEKLTGQKAQQIDDEIAQERITNNPPTQEVIILAGGDVLCYDMLTGRYFRSTVEQIKKAEHMINRELTDTQSASLSQFYDEVGLPATTYTDTVGWNSFEDGTIDVRLSTAMSPKQEPCIAVDFNVHPHPNYTRVYE